MPVYRYKALSAGGAKIEGSHTANTKDEIIEMLRHANQYPISVEEAVEGGRDLSGIFGGFSGVSKRDLGVFCRQFYTMLNAGVTVINCLSILRHQTENRRLAKVVIALLEDVQKGIGLSDAMKKHGKIFPELMTNMIAVGEVSGNLDEIMDRMATHYEKENRIMSKVKSSMIYPAVLAFVATSVVIFLLIFVMPTFVTMFQSSGVELPLPTKILLFISDVLVKYGLIVLIAAIGAIYGIIRFAGSDKGSYLFDSLKLKLPVIKGTSMKIYTSRFSRTLATLISSGIPLIQALEVVSRVVENRVVERDLLKAIEDVKKGVSLSVPVRNMGHFPPMLHYMLSIGEESGSIDDIMNRTANYYDEEVDIALTRMTALMEPLMILVMALVVGGIAVAMVMPMFDMMNTVR